jgi:hypothetical protein
MDQKLQLVRYHLAQCDPDSVAVAQLKLALEVLSTAVEELKVRQGYQDVMNQNAMHSGYRT